MRWAEMREVGGDAGGGLVKSKNGGGGIQTQPHQNTPKAAPWGLWGLEDFSHLRPVQRRTPLFLLACSGCDYGNLASRHVVLSDSRSGSCSGQGKGRRFPNIDDNVTI